MVTILPQFDPGKEIGQSFGQGFGDALKLLGQRQLGISALEGLKGLDLENMSAADIMAEVGKATVGFPQLQRQAGEMTEALIREKRAAAMKKGLQRGARGVGDQVPGDQVEETIGIDSVAGQVAPDRSPGQPDVEGTRGVQPGLEAGGLRDVPLLEEQTGREPLLSGQEIAQISLPFVESGDMAGMQEAISQARQQKLQQRELQIKAAEARTQELNRRRELEKELAQNVLARTDNLLASNNIQGGEQWHRLAYDYFQNERQKRPQASDETLWQEAGRKVERKINDIAGAANEHYRPTWRGRKETRAKSAQQWAQDHLKKYGNTPEDRNLLKSIMMDNGWSREEASAIVQPFSDSLSKSFDQLSKVPGQQLAYRPDQLPMPQAKRSERVAKFEEKAIPELAKSFSKDDSLLLLKNRLVRDKGLTDDEAIRVINGMREQGVELTEEQVAEEAFIKNLTVPSLYDLFSGRGITEVFGPLVK